MDRLELARKEAELLEAGTPYAAVTIVHSAGTARTEGKMLVLPDETIYGTVGGGAGEKLAIRDAVTLLAGGENAVRRYELDSPLSAAGQACGGSLTVFIESCRATRPQLIMVGGGHVGLALLRAARLAGFSTTLLDTRGEEMIAPAIKAADRFIQLENFGEALANTRLPAGAYYVVASYSHAADGEALGGVLHHTDAAYVGMIGSRRSHPAKAHRRGYHRTAAGCSPFPHRAFARRRDPRGDRRFHSGRTPDDPLRQDQIRPVKCKAFRPTPPRDGSLFI